MTTWDRTADLVIVGSGGGGMVAALAAKDAGIEPLVLEKQAVLGGSTAMSGGVIWLPDNPLMAAEGVPDSFEDGMAYFDDVVGDAGPASSVPRRRAYLAEGSAMVSFLQAKGVRLARCEGYSDYYPNAKGGNARGRSVEPRPFDGRRLGAWQGKIQPGMAQGIGLAVKTNEVRSISLFNRSAANFGIAAAVWLRTMIGRLRGQELLTNGASLIAQLVKVALDERIPLWPDTAVDDLVVEDGRAVGVRVTRDGRSQHVRARRGVLLAAGGFARNAEMRRAYGGDQPNEAAWTAANPGDTGETLAAAIRLGARTDLLDEAWWLPMPGAPELAGSALASARQLPGTILVDAAGRRFCNEANSYVEVGKAMYARDREAQAVPCWLIFDDGFRRRYPAAKSLPGRMPKTWFTSGAVARAGTLEELARRIAVDPAGLAGTVRRFNTHARRGEDPDYGRGQSAYNACLGDPAHRPNPALGPLDRAPYHAVRIYPSDVGTCGGLLTDEHARVIGAGDAPIPGLYATGNCTATVMGRKYLGAGASIANSMIFGYVAARHISIEEARR